MTGPEDGTSLEVRAILHLSLFPSCRGRKVCPRGTTQAGMAEKLGADRSYIALVLGRAVKKGLVEVDKAYVNGNVRMVKVYSLTAKGLRMAVDYKQMRREEASPPPNVDGPKGDSEEHVAPGLGQSPDVEDVEWPDPLVE